MIIIGDSHNKSLSEGLADKLSCQIIYPEITVFADSEQRVRIPEDKISGETVLVVKSCEIPVDSSALQTAFLIDAANRSGAEKVIAVIPYFPYMRADHVFRTGEAVPLEVVIKLIESARPNEIVIVDPHSIKIPELFSVSIKNISALNLFSDKIREIESDMNNVTIVSPDMGGLRRLEILDELLGGGINQVFINKDRDYESGKVSVAEYKGDIRGTCIIVDDIISTGKTIAQAVETLANNGAGDIYVMATHPVFSENSIDLLQKSEAVKVFVTDSIPVVSEKKFEKLEVLPLAKLIAESL